MSVDAGFADWLKSIALYESRANPGLASALLPMSQDSEMLTPFAAQASATTEIARQGGFLDSALALDSATIKGKRVDLVGKCIDLRGDQLGYSPAANGPELLTNAPTFSGTTGWGTITGTTLSIVSGKLRATATGNNLNQINQTVTGLVVGETYRVHVDQPVLGGGQTGNPLFQLGTDAFNLNYRDAVIPPTDFEFVAAFPTFYWSILTNGLSGGAGGYMEIANPSLKKGGLTMPVLVIGAQEQDDATTQLTVLRKL